MSVELREITPENFKECIALKVADEQENFVSSNVVSIAQAKIYPTATQLAVYSGDEMVGFVMYFYKTDDLRYYILRLMIDERFQGKGYGKAATLEVIKLMKQIEDCREIYLCFMPENTNAERVYKSVGFERTGEIHEGEIVMRYDLNKSTDNEQRTTDN